MCHKLQIASLNSIVWIPALDKKRPGRTLRLNLALVAMNRHISINTMTLQMAKSSQQRISKLEELTIEQCRNSSKLI